MRLIVNIPDEEYKTLSELSEKEKVNELSYYEKVIVNGIPYQERLQGDLVSREALKKHKFPINIANGVEIEEIEVVPVGAIDNAPTVRIDTNDIEYKAYCKGIEDGKKIARPQGKWIPVSERLPEGRIDPNINDFEYVLCSTTWDDVRPYKFGKRIGEQKAHFWLGGAILDKYITAWQPFPESYKKGSAE